MTENKQYTYNDFGEIFKDKEIFAYSCSMSNAKAICKELNDKEKEIHRLKKTNKELKTQIEPIQKICKKYKIPLEDLPEVLEEYITYDNEEYLEKLQNQ